MGISLTSDSVITNSLVAVARKRRENVSMILAMTRDGKTDGQPSRIDINFLAYTDIS